MLFTIASTLLAAAGFSAAQSNIQITVGLSAGAPDVFMFQPANVTATAGTVITFTYSGSPGNHSVTQSSFADPCNPLPGGFDSGNVFIPMGTTSGFPTWNLTVTNDTTPIWFFCKQLAPAPHCGVGMVGAINAPTTGTNTFDAFQMAAEQDKGPSGQGIGGLVGIGASASAVPGPFSGGITGFGLPTGASGSVQSSTGTGAGATGTSTSPATTTNAASSVQLSGVYLVIATFFGVVLA